jgi:hypothetical protein
MQDGDYFSRVLYTKYGTIFTDCNQVLLCSSLLGHNNRAQMSI